jgi:hypothetical protein
MKDDDTGMTTAFSAKTTRPCLIRAFVCATALVLPILGGCSVGFRSNEPADAQAASDEEKPEKKEEMKPYAEVVTEEAVSDSGMFVVHRIEEKVLFEIPESMLEREMLLVSRRAKTAERLGFGGMKNNTQTIRWQRHDDRILLRVSSHELVAADSLPIYEAVVNATFEPIVKAFDIEDARPQQAAPRAFQGQRTRREPELRQLGEKLPSQHRSPSRTHLLGSRAAHQHLHRDCLPRDEPLDDPAPGGADAAAPLG